MNEPLVICKVDWAAQPDLLFRCDGDWSVPAWGAHPETRTDLPEGVYRATNGRNYTFEEDKITCEACKAAPPRSPE